MSSADPDAIALLREDLLDENDTTRALATLAHLPAIAVSVGADRCRDVLFPFLLEYVSEGEGRDEALGRVAAQLGGEAVTWVGGAEHASGVVAVLEKICRSDETSVRASAVRALRGVVAALPLDAQVRLVLPVLERLCKDSEFLPRHSACALLPCVYPAAVHAARGAEVREWFLQLCDDEATLVRRAACEALPELAGHLSAEDLVGDFYAVLKGLAENELDSFRVYALPMCAVACGRVKEDVVVAYMLPIVEALHQDPSWRVRLSFCTSVERLCANVGKSLAAHRVLPLFKALLHDHENRVREEAVKHLVATCARADNPDALVEHIAPVLEHLVRDEVDTVREACAHSLVGLFAAFGAEHSNRLLVPLFGVLLADSAVSVRNAVLSNVDSVASVIGIETVLQVIVPPMLLRITDDSFRVRLEVLDHIVSLGVKVGPERFENLFLQPVLDRMRDTVFAVRCRACECGPRFIQAFGPEWTEAKVLPSAIALFDTTKNYLFRMASLVFVARTATRFPRSVVEQYYLPLVLTALVDAVDNVKSEAAKTLVLLLPSLTPADVRDKCIPALNGLLSEPDGEVAWEAETALKECRARLG